MALNSIPFHGKTCRIEKDGTELEYNVDWNIDVTIDIGDGKRMGQQWKEGYPGLTQWDGSFKGSFAPGNTEQKAFFDNIVAAIPGIRLDDIDFNLDSSDNYFEGAIYVASLRITVDVNNKVEFDIGFRGHGVLFNSWGGSGWCICASSATGGGETSCGPGTFDVFNGIYRYIGLCDLLRGVTTFSGNCLTNCGFGENNHTVTPAMVGGSGCKFKEITIKVWTG